MIRVDELSKNYCNRFCQRSFKALDKVSFTIDFGETLGLIGESGSGKSTLARTMLGLIPPSSGKVLFNGKEVLSDKQRIPKELRGKMQIIFQHPESALNPRFTIFDSLVEPMKIQNKSLNKIKMKEEVCSLLEQVGLSKEHLYRYPHELSGGQIQRVVLARILSIKPDFIIADEPTSMLDVSVQAQVIHILQDIQKSRGIGMLFISHDLNLVSCISDRIAMMFKGQIVEIAPAKAFKKTQLHPYSSFLSESFSSLSNNTSIKSEYKTINKYSDGCSYAPYCPNVCEKCRQKPLLREKSNNHFVSCWQA